MLQRLRYIGFAVLIDVRRAGTHTKMARHQPTYNEVTCRPFAETHGEVDLVFHNVDGVIDQV